MTEILLLDPSAGIANGGGVPGVLPVRPVYASACPSGGIATGARDS